MDWITLSKLASELLRPTNIVLWSMIIAVILLLLRRRNSALFFLVFAILIVVLASSPIIGWLYGKIDKAYLPTPIESSPNAQAIVVLAGDVAVPIAPRIESQIRGNRILHASRLYKSKKAPLIIVSGGNVFKQRNVEPESYYSRKILMELGVPLDAILVEGNSRNTRENAIGTQKILNREGIERVLLVTSSFHMPRALATFRKIGIQAIPSTSSVGAYEDKPQVLRLLDKFPSLGELGRLQRVIQEVLGICVYCYRDWLDCNSLYEEIF